MFKNLSIFVVLAATVASPSVGQNAGTQMAARAPAPVAQQAAVPQSVVPAPEVQTIMIRNALLALSQANLTNNYTVLNALGSASFRRDNSPQRLSQSFEAFRANRIDMAPISLIAPQATSAPRVENGRLRLIGQFPSMPMSVNYDLTFEPEQNSWKLAGIGVNLVRADTK